MPAEVESRTERGMSSMSLARTPSRASAMKMKPCEILGGRTHSLEILREGDLSYKLNDLGACTHHGQRNEDQAPPEKSSLPCCPNSSLLTSMNTAARAHCEAAQHAAGSAVEAAEQGGASAVDVPAM